MSGVEQLVAASPTVCNSATPLAPQPNSSTQPPVNPEQAAPEEMKKEVDFTADEFPTERKAPTPQLLGQNASAYIIISDKDGGRPVELPLDPDYALPVSTLQIEYTGATGLKYRNPETGIFRIVAPGKDNRLYPPLGGWGMNHFIACCPKAAVDSPWLAGGTNVPSSSLNSLLPVPEPLLSSQSPFSRANGSAGGYGRMPGSLMGMQSGLGGYDDGLGGFSGVGGYGYGGGGGFKRGPLPPQSDVVPAKLRRNGPATSYMTPGYERRPAGKSPTTAAGTSGDKGVGQRGDGGGTYGHCKVCDLALNSENQAKDHYSGKKHKEMAEGGTVSSVRPTMGRGGGAFRGSFRGGGTGGNRGASASSSVPKAVKPIVDYSSDFTSSDLGGSQFSHF